MLCKNINAGNKICTVKVCPAKASDSAGVFENMLFFKSSPQPLWSFCLSILLRGYLFM